MSLAYFHNKQNKGKKKKKTLSKVVTGTLKTCWHLHHEQKQKGRGVSKGSPECWSPLVRWVRLYSLSPASTKTFSLTMGTAPSCCLLHQSHKSWFSYQPCMNMQKMRCWDRNFSWQRLRVTYEYITWRVLRRSVGERWRCNMCNISFLFSCSQEITLTDLKPFTQYIISLRVKNPVGMGPPTKVVVMTDEGGAYYIRQLTPYIPRTMDTKIEYIL